MSEFKVIVRTSRDSEKDRTIVLEVTHNGRQWSGICLSPSEAEEIINALRDYLNSGDFGL